MSVKPVVIASSSTVKVDSQSVASVSFYTYRSSCVDVGVISMRRRHMHDRYSQS